MKDYLLLLRVNIKTMLRGALTDGIRNEKGKIRPSFIILYILAAIGVVTLAGMVIWMETALYRTVAALSLLPGMHLEKLLIGLALLMSMVMTLLFGIFHTLGAMYFNRDTAATAYLPIGQRTQMAARWTEIYLGELMFSVAILLPMLVNHGIAQGFGAGYYLSAAVTLIVTPMYPLSIALLLASLLARISSLTRHKEIWIVIGTLLLLALVLGSEWLLLPRIPEDADSLFFINLLVNNEALLTFIIGAFPPVLWAISGVSGNVAMLALYLLVGIGAVALVIFVMGGSFQRVCLKHTEHGVKSRRAEQRTAVSFREASPFMAIFRREMNEVLKTPVYLMNAVLGVLMMPIMLMGMSVGMTSSDASIDLQNLLTQITEALPATDLMLILAAVFSLMSFMCPITSTAISREGKRLPIMKMIPVSTRTILWAKLAVGLTIICVGSLIMGVACTVLLGVTYLPHVLGAVLLSDLLACAIGSGNLLVDLLKPMLSWKSENEVMKQNMNTLFGMLVSVVMMALVVVPTLMLNAQAPWLRMLTACGVLLAELAVSIWLLCRIGSARLSSLEP